VAWSNPSPASAPPAGDAVLAWDALGQRLVLVPSPTSSGPLPSDTYTWNGAAWTTIAPAPLGQRATGLAGHPAAGLVMLSASTAPYTAGESVNVLVGNAWQPLPNAPDARTTGGTLAFDANRSEIVLLVGSQRRDLMLSMQAANALTSGSGCPGSNGVPVLAAANLPQLAASSRVDILHAAPSSVAFLFADLAPASVPLPGGCTQLVANPILLAVAPTNAAGFASATWAIPANPAVRGIVVLEQALTLDPNGALLGFASLTGALQLRVGD
jgi:hypothetical protein